MDDQMAERVAFFREHGGYVVRPGETEGEARERSARDYAAAEAGAEGGYVFTVEPDDLPWDGDEPYDGPLWVVAIRPVCRCCGVPGEAIGTVGSVACPEGDPYLRVIMADLAMECTG